VPFAHQGRLAASAPKRNKIRHKQFTKAREAKNLTSPKKEMTTPPGTRKMKGIAAGEKPACRGYRTGKKKLTRLLCHTKRHQKKRSLATHGEEKKACRRCREKKPPCVKGATEKKGKHGFISQEKEADVLRKKKKGSSRNPCYSESIRGTKRGPSSQSPRKANVSATRREKRILRLRNSAEAKSP